MGALDQAGAPLKAYEVLGQLKDQGVTAPMTVYRALDRLEGKGLVHKLDALGAFVVCRHGAPHELQTFLVCEGCANVTEVTGGQDGQLPISRQALSSLAVSSGFEVSAARLEVRGRCRD